MSDSKERNLRLAQEIDGELLLDARMRFLVVDDITRRLDSGVYVETKCDCTALQFNPVCSNHLSIEFAHLAARSQEWARGLEYHPGQTAPDELKRLWHQCNLHLCSKRDLETVLSWLLYKSLLKSHEWNNLSTGNGGMTPKVDDVFGFFRLRLYADCRLSFADVYRETGSFPEWFPSADHGLECVVRECSLGRVAGQHNVLDCHPVANKTYRDYSSWAERLAPHFISAGLWCVVRVWLAAYQVSKGSAHAEMLIRPTNSLVCAQWARAPRNLAIPESDRKHASPLDLIMGFAGLHYNYLQAVAGAVILPRPEAIKVGCMTLRQGLLTHEVVKKIEARIDAERGIPLAYQFDSSDSDMQDEDVPRKRGAKRAAISMSD